MKRSSRAERLSSNAAHAALAMHNARLYRQIEERAILRERERLAVDLHDTLAQIFFSIGMEVERVAEALPPEAQGRLGDLRDLVARGTARVRGAISELYGRGGVPRDANLYRRLSACIDELRRETGLQVALVASGDVHRVPGAHREALCRVVREALTNVHKHARADMAVVNLVVGPDRVRLTVQDNGAGLPAGALDDAPALHRFGLAAMRRQMERLGGALEVGNGEEGGCVLRAWAPLERGNTRDTDSRAGGG